MFDFYAANEYEVETSKDCILTILCHLCISTGGKIWEANMEKTGESCGGPRGGQQPEIARAHPDAPGNHVQ